MTTFGIIGTGQMGGAIAKALRERGLFSCLYAGRGSLSFRIVSFSFFRS